MSIDKNNELKVHYSNTLKVAAVISLMLLIALFVAFKKFDTQGAISAVDVPAIELQDIPLTKILKKVVVPPKPVMPIEDPETPIEKNIEIPGIKNWNIISPRKVPPPPPTKEPVDWFKVEIKPELVGGNQEIAKYIVKNNLFPRMAREAGVSGNVIIGFVVDIEGVPTDVHLIQEKPEGLGFGEAGVEVMKAMRFTPGYQRDKPVPVRMSQPISFTFGNN